MVSININNLIQTKFLNTIFDIKPEWQKLKAFVLTNADLECCGEYFLKEVPIETSAKGTYILSTKCKTQDLI
ncbi:MAG: hypothetical protein O2970_11460 [Proteobacteria bacterium]|nr:hypothetical protein [Pseudomonadota bacterium]